MGWFSIDLIAVIPFEVILGTTNLNEFVRMTRIGRLYKLIKLAKLMRVMKLIRDRSNIMKYVQEILQIGIGFQRLVFFLLYFTLFCHVIACLWVMSASVEDNYKGTWMESEVNGVKYHDMALTDQYLSSFYYTITTITTVGYGDISGKTALEKVFCIIIMFVGVLTFSFASGQLASILQNYDSNNAKFEEKIDLLNRIQKEYFIPLDMYQRLK